jgi:hypothetical protein
MRSTILKPLILHNSDREHKGFQIVGMSLQAMRNLLRVMPRAVIDHRKFQFVMLSGCFLLQMALPLTPRLAAQNSEPALNESNPPAGESSVTLPAGTVISVRIADEVNSNRNHPGDVFTGTVDPSVFVEDHVVIPRGTEAHIQMVDAKKGGHIHGKEEVELELVSLVLNGERSDVDTDAVAKKKGAISTKAHAEVKPGAAGAAEVAVSVNPVGAVAVGGIAAFKAAKVDMKPGSRMPFTLSGPFTFTPPLWTQPSPDDESGKSIKKKH